LRRYKYEFWRPITAIRNGDIDGNPATERDATWQPIGGSEEIPEVSLTSPFAPGVTHRFTNLRVYSDEVANARICAGFHYRFSTIAGREMGRKIGAYT
jgi:hypothetical protein